MQNPNSFPTSEQAEEAFYRSFHQGDIELMMSVWCQDRDIVCIHPGGSRLQGGAHIRKSWEQIFSCDQNIELGINRKKIMREQDVAIHHVVEDILIDGEVQSEIFATNVYVRVKNSWHMILHHASAELYTALESQFDETEEAQIIH